MEISDFLGTYPLREDYDFIDKITNKKEFSELKLETNEPIPKRIDGKKQPFKHQQTVARILSSNTTIDSHLIIHGVGSGKAFVSINFAESIMRGDNEYNEKTLVLLPGKLLVKTFKQELMEYSPEYKRDSFEDGKIISNKSIRDNYEIYTYESFAGGKDLLNKGNEISLNHAIKKYSNRVVILDEVQYFNDTENYTGMTREEIRNKKLKKDKSLLSLTRSQTYNIIHRFLHGLKNTKKLLLTATPWRDKPHEIAYIMNLILPLNDENGNHQMPTGNEFIKRYFDGVNLKKEMLSELYNYFKGYVSYLRVPADKMIHKKYVMKKGLENDLNIYADVMSDYQSKIYNLAENKLDAKGKTVNKLNILTLQASNFVFPEDKDDPDKSLYGTSGVGENLVVKRGGRMKSWEDVVRDEDKDVKNRKMIYKKIVNGKVVRIPEGKRVKTKITEAQLSRKLIKELKGADGKRDTIINNIRKYSEKFANCLDEITKSKECSFVYFNIVTGSGAVLFSRLLELLNYSMASDGYNIETKRDRYAILTDATATTNQSASILRRFNRPDNHNGDFIKIIIGSRVVGKGISIFHCKQAHLMTPFWNLSESDQALGRIFRVNSYETLKKLNPGEKITVRIFLHSSVLDSDEKTVEWRMNEVARDKDKMIKQVEHVTKVIASDCILNIERNKLPNELDDTRQCDYTKCDYKCIRYDNVTNNIEEIDTIEGEEDYTTYLMYYSDLKMREIVKLIVKIFSTTFSADLSQIVELLSEYDLSLILKSLNDLVYNRRPIRNKYGFITYLKEDNNLYFLSNNKTKETFLLSYYSENPYMSSNKSIIDLIEKVKAGNTCILIEQLNNLEIEDYSEITNIINMMHPVVVEYILEKSILKTRDGDEGLYKSIVQHLEKYIVKKEDIIIVSYIREKYHSSYRCLIDGKWGDCDDIVKITEKKESKVEVKNTCGNISGTLIDGKFRIKSTKRGKGKMCNTFQLHQLIKIILDCKIEIKIKKTDDIMSKLKGRISKQFDLHSMSIDELQKLYTLNTLKRAELCRILEKHIISN